MYIDKLIRKEVITLLISVAFLVVVFIGVTFAKFLSVDKGEKTVINMGDLNISFCNNSTCDTTYSNIGQVIGTKVENGVTVPASIYPFKNDGTYSNETPYIFKIENTGSLDSTVKIKLKEDATYTPTGDYSSYTRLSLKYPEHLKVAIRKKVTFEDTGYQLGDVNMDGIVNKTDADLILAYCAKNATFTDLQKKLADINSDSKIRSIDAGYLLQLINGKRNIEGVAPTYIYSYTDLEDGVIFKDDIIKSGESATYFLWLYLDESTPNDVQNTFFVGNIDVEGEFIPRNTVFCTTNTELTDGVTYVNGQYTYTYSGTTNDWKVVLTDATSTDPVTSEVCTYINNKPITSMASMFNGSLATSIDLSSFNTSNVTNMDGMFQNIAATTLNLSNFDTSNVTNMRRMFRDCQATLINLNSFDTSNVTNMLMMFTSISATTLDLSSFDTSNVVNMGRMFQNTQLETIYVSSKFNINNVTLSTNMFAGSTNLVGGAGTKYDSTKTDKTYARIDGGTSSPGYFTDVADKNIPAPNSFATDSWKTIIKAVRNNNISKYSVGATKTIDMGTYGTHTLRIANTSTPSECSTTGFSQTACGFVLEFADIITTHNMNPAGTYKGTTYQYGWNVDGWPATSMRTFVNNDIYNAIPSEIKNAIIDTTVVSGHGSTSGETNFTSTDKLYLLSTAEVLAQGSSNTISTDTARDVTRQLDYYKNLGTSTSNYSGAIKKNGTSDSYWWLRAAISSNTVSFFRVYDSGGCGSNYAYGSIGVSPAFRLG